jgi:hypothetical protein
VGVTVAVAVEVAVIVVAVVAEIETEDPVPAARETGVINFSFKIYSQIISSSYRSILFL